MNAPIVLLNGQWVPESDAKISILDRSFLYGDGLFETVRVSQGRPFRWPEHSQRLRRGAEYLGIRMPVSDPELADQAAELIRRNGVQDGVLRVTLSRGVGGAGYSPQGANQPSLAMTMRPAPAVDPRQPSSWRLVTASVRLTRGDPLARFKTCNKLQQVIARAEADANGADEALLLNVEGEMAEAAASNVFWVEEGGVCTPSLHSPALPGVTRGAVLEICADLGVSARERRCPPAALRESQGAFLTLSSQGVVEALSMDGQPLARSPLTLDLHRAYQALLARETSVL